MKNISTLLRALIGTFFIFCTSCGESKTILHSQVVDDFQVTIESFTKDWADPQIVEVIIVNKKTGLVVSEGFLGAKTWRGKLKFNALTICENYLTISLASHPNKLLHVYDTQNRVTWTPWSNDSSKTIEQNIKNCKGESFEIADLNHVVGLIKWGGAR
jgi:hypothetical protein